MIVLSVGFNFPCHFGATNTTFSLFGITFLRNRTLLCSPRDLTFEAVKLMPFHRHFFLGVLLTNECFEVTTVNENWFLFTWDRRKTLSYPPQASLLIDPEHLHYFPYRIAHMSLNNLGIESGHISHDRFSPLLSLPREVP